MFFVVLLTVLLIPWISTYPIYSSHGHEKLESHNHFHKHTGSEDHTHSHLFPVSDGHRHEHRHDHVHLSEIVTELGEIEFGHVHGVEGARFLLAKCWQTKDSVYLRLSYLDSKTQERSPLEIDSDKLFGQVYYANEELGSLHFERSQGLMMAKRNLMDNLPAMSLVIGEMQVAGKNYELKVSIFDQIAE